MIHVQEVNYPSTSIYLSTIHIQSRALGYRQLHDYSVQSRYNIKYSRPDEVKKSK